MFERLPVADLTESGARAERDRLAERTDVLARVSVLRCLPDDLHCTTPMVAEFYQVDADTIRKAVLRNREELDDDGYLVLKPAEVSDMLSLTPSDLALPNGTSQVALFPRRAVLRIGMLLRDSAVARRVRDYLLNIEQFAIPRTMPEALRLAADAMEARDRAEQRAQAGEQFKRAIEGGDGLGIRVFHKKYFSTVSEHEFFDHLYAKGLLIDQRGKGSLRTSGPRAGSYRNGSQHRHPGFRGKPYFYMHGDRDKSGVRRENAHVRPGEPELALRDLLVAQGLPANETTHGIYALSAGKDS